MKTTLLHLVNVGASGYLEPRNLGDLSGWAFWFPSSWKVILAWIHLRVEHIHVYELPLPTICTAYSLFCCRYFVEVEAQVRSFHDLCSYSCQL